MSALGDWWRWRRELARLRRDASAAYDRWMRAHYAYHDLAVVMRGQPGEWDACGKALDQALELSDEYRALRAQAERLERTGP